MKDTKIPRKIPAVMATQHPDNAGAPYWDEKGDGFISTLGEVKECLECFQELGVDEYMWDWEGKHADAAVVDKLLSDHHDFFSQKQLAKDIFLTFRLPNIWTEKGYSLMQAMTSILLAEDFAGDLKFKQRPLFEVILPMTERADQLMKMHTLFEQLARFKTKAFDSNHKNTDYLELIPLVESVDSQLAVDRLMQDYVELHQQHYGRAPNYIRLFLARSDPAMASGMLATVIANKIALAKLNEFSARSSIPVFPIAGVGGLPFRGGLIPSRVKAFIKNNPGLSTVSVQSSFRYDHPKNQVKKAIKLLEKDLQAQPSQLIEVGEQKILSKIAKDSETLYQGTLQQISEDMMTIFKSVPRRRERRLHTGLIAYQRLVGKQSLPRAITFTCGFYSIGVPPEFIGLGRTLNNLSTEQLRVVLKNYPSLKQDLEFAGRYLNKNNLTKLANNNSGWQEILQDVRLSESILSMNFGPRSRDEKAHKKLTSKVLRSRKNLKKLPAMISELAKIRKSLG